MLEKRKVFKTFKDLHNHLFKALKSTIIDSKNAQLETSKKELDELQAKEKLISTQIEKNTNWLTQFNNLEEVIC